MNIQRERKAHSCTELWEKTLLLERDHNSLTRERERNSYRGEKESSDVISYNALLNGFCNLGKIDEAYGLLETFERDEYDLGLLRV